MLYAATWVDLEIIILSKVNQKEKDKYLYVETKIRHKWTYIWNKTDPQIEQTCGCQGRVGKGRIESLGLTDANYYI